MSEIDQTESGNCEGLYSPQLVWPVWAIQDCNSTFIVHLSLENLQNTFVDSHRITHDPRPSAQCNAQYIIESSCWNLSMKAIMFSVEAMWK